MKVEAICIHPSSGRVHYSNVFVKHAMDEAQATRRLLSHQKVPFAGCFAPLKTSIAGVHSVLKKQHFARVSAHCGAPDCKQRSLSPQRCCTSRLHLVI